VREGLSSPTAPRGDGTEQIVDKILISCKSYYFFLQVSSAHVVTVASEGIKITLQRTYNAVNYRLG